MEILIILKSILILVSILAYTRYGMEDEPNIVPFIVVAAFIAIEIYSSYLALEYLRDIPIK